MKKRERKGNLPELGKHAVPGQLGEACVEVAILNLGQLYERRSGLDFGVDGVIELVTEREVKQASGRQVAVQVKRGLSVVTKTRYGRTLYCTEQHANYWLGHSLPVIVVHCEPETKRLRWQHVSGDTLRHTPHGYAIDLPEQSDLCTALQDLRSLANARTVSEGPLKEILLLPYSLEKGVLVPEEELGLNALAFSRAALRGTACQIEIEFEGEADLIASIDAVRDLSEPTAEQRKDAIIRQDILELYRKHAQRLRRVLTLLLTEPLIAAEFGYQEQLLASAVHRTARPWGSTQKLPNETYLQAWPGPYVERPIVGFDVLTNSLDDFYARSDMNRHLIRMGNMGGVMISELPHEVVASRFLPALVHGLANFADANGLSDSMVMEKIGIPPTLWLVGVA
ncbi:MAG: DUF4365 domain-containing protein [Mesorhizobium sp.]|uniref:DUF4365 domain-containing protein n=1 Tax=Mesorhizobium sp. TaxID=1871066 RepID=UPI000FE4801B|nr:DUF4365 domain-containing protein [Mesorhizobium sp.]RWC25944.1 MAG: DUF4365 domain-containing protein [Mesorhizobium sp.]